jgi:hypothetical protein
MKEKVPFRGVPFEYEDTYLILPPLYIDDVRDLSKRFDKHKEGEENWLDERYVVMKEAISNSILLNYPELKDAIDTVLRKFVTMVNVNKLYAAAMGFGTESLAPAAKSLGEIKPVGSTNLSTGPSSTGGSVLASV